MTLDEAIKHAEEVAKEYRNKLKFYENINDDRPLFTEEETECRCYAEEYRQLVEWLKELKEIKQIIAQHDADSMPEDFWYIDQIREVVEE